MQIQWIRTQDKNDLWRSVTYDPCLAGELQRENMLTMFCIFQVSSEYYHGLFIYLFIFTAKLIMQKE